MSLTDTLDIAEKKFEFELAHLGDLSKYNFAQLSKQLSQFNVDIDNFGSYFNAHFESPFSVLAIQFDSSGFFLKIINQYWK